jgi:predicted NBD/HSP70 family sugar kinase
MTHTVKDGTTTRRYSHAYLRERNTALVLEIVVRHGSMSQREMSKRSGLSFTSVVSIVTRLEKKGILRKADSSPERAGRPATMYSFDPTYRFVLGCEIQHDVFQLVLADLEGHIAAQKTIPFEQGTGKEAMLALLIRSLEDLVAGAGRGMQDLLGIGIGIGGLVNVQNDSVEFLSHLPNWGELPLKSTLQDHFKLKTSVENNSASAALGELRFGVGSGKKNFLFINVKSGIGMGIVLNGGLYRGTTGTAGEFGHITVDDHGPVCVCGNVGCLETLASISALVDNAKRSVRQGVASSIREFAGGDPDQITFDVILEAVKHEDKLAYKLFIDAGRYLGEGIVSLVNLLNPELIVIGGELARAKEYVLGPITDVMKRQALGIPRKAVEVTFSSLAENAGALGATVPLIDDFLVDPLRS